MKVMGQGMLVGSGSGRAAAAELLRFNLSQPVASVIIGCAQMALLGQNIQAALSFTPASESDKQRLREKIASSCSAWENFLRTHRTVLSSDGCSRSKPRWSQGAGHYLALIPSSFCASLKIERSATFVNGISRSTLAVFLASSIIKRNPASGSEPSSLKLRTALS